MKTILTTIFLSLLTTTAFASEKYSCSVAANPQAGVKKPFDLTIEPNAQGGELIMIQNGKEKSLGEISQVVTLNRADKNLRFEIYLAALAETPVSGIEPADLKSLTSIRFLSAKTRKGNYIVYQLIAGDEVIGGSLQVGDKFTSCLPQ